MLKKSLIIFFVLVCALLFFENQFVFKGVEWALESSVKKSFGTELAYTSLEKEGRRLTYKDPRIKGEGESFAADSISITYDLKLLSRTLVLNIHVDNPVLNLEEQLSDLDFNYEPQSLLSILKLKGKVKFTNGKISLKNKVESFEIDFDFNKDKSLTLSFGKSLLKYASLNHGKNYSVDLDFNSFSLKDLGFIQDKLFPAECKVKVKSGEVSGKAHIVGKKGLRKNIQGKLSVNNAALVFPQEEIFASAQEILLDLEPSESNVMNESFPWLPSLVGQVSIKGGALAFSQDAYSMSKLLNLSGLVVFHKEDKLLLSLKGDHKSHGEASQISLNGHVDYRDASKLTSGLYFENLRPKKDPSSVEFQTVDLGASASFSQMKLKNFGLVEFSLIDSFVKRFFPDSKLIDLKEGSVDALIKASWSKGSLAKVEMNDLSVRNLHAVLYPWGLDLGAENLSGNVKMDFSLPQPQGSLNAELNVVNGTIFSQSLESELWKLEDIQTKIIINDGVLQKSHASVSMAGLKGRAEIDWRSKNEIGFIELEGKGSELALFLPERFESALMDSSKDDHIKVTATLTDLKKGMSVFGGMRIFDSLGADTYLDFHFDLVLGQSAFSQFYSLDEESSDYWESYAHDLIFQSYPPSTMGHALALFEAVQNDSALHGLKIKNGYFGSDHIDLKKYASPYLFKNNYLNLSGIGRLRGNFDLNSIHVEYSGRNLTLENDKLKVEMPEISPQNPGHHFLNFRSQNHRGTLSLKEAAYTDKVKDLQFQILSSDMTIIDKKTFLENIECFSNDVFFSGQILIDNTDPRDNAYDVYVSANQMEGRFSDVSKILKKIDPGASIFQIPIEGNVNLREQGFSLIFHVKPEAYSWTGAVEGSFREGFYENSNLLLKAQDLSFNFDYSKEKNEFRLNDMEASLLIGEPENEDEYVVHAEDFHLTDLDHVKGQFDVNVLDKNGEIARFKGDIKPEGLGSLLSFHSDACHFGTILPKDFEMKFKDLNHIDSAKFVCDFRLSDLVYELSRFSKSGLLFWPARNFQGIGGPEMALGNVKTQFFYDGDKGELSWEIDGDKVCFKDLSCSKLKVCGSKIKDHWSFKEIQLDDLSLSCDLVKERELWTINYFGAKYKDALIAGMEGIYDSDKDEAEGKITFFECNLSELRDVPSIRDFSAEWPMKGILRGTGKWQAGLVNGEWKGGLNLLTQMKDFKIKNLYFEDLSQASLDFSWDKKLTLTNLNGVLTDGNRRASLEASKVMIDAIHRDFEISKLHFHIAADDLKWIADSLYEALPEKITPSIRESIKNLKREGDVEGFISINSFSGLAKLEISFLEGWYRFFGQDHYLKNFLLTSSQDELFLTTQYQFENQLLWVFSKTELPYDSGIVIISDGFNTESDDPLRVHWVKEEARGLVLKKLEGSVSGLKLALEENHDNPTTSSAYSLIGDISVDLEQASNLFSPEIQERILTLKAGQGYKASGTLQIEKEKSSNDRKYDFEGAIYGNAFDIKGYQFEHFHADAYINEKKYYLKNISLLDPALTMQVPEIHFDKDDAGLWYVNCARMEVNEFRPSLLQEKEGFRPLEPKPLFIRQIYLHDLNGYCSDLSTLQAQGYLTFINPMKNNLHNTIFALPGEIMSRIGIDLLALTPVSGTIHFSVHDEKVFLTKFKDIYSERKLSKFNLADKNPSYMDFDGNLRVQVKMKQYTLLFKLAELFTFNISGTITHPSYSIRKQNMKEDIQLIGEKK